MFCPACGKELPSEREGCPACGSTQHTVRIQGDPMSRPGILTLIAVLDLVVGLLFSTAGVSGLAFGTGGSFDLVFGASILLLGALHIATGIGLLGLRPWARKAQIVLSIVGLLGFPIGTVISALILFYLFRPGMVVLFSGKSSEQLTLEELRSLADLRGKGAMIALIVVVVAMVPICGIISAIAIPNFLNAIDRGKQKRTMADMQSIGTAVDHYSIEHGGYPSARSVEELLAALGSPGVGPIPDRDGWGHPFRVSCEPSVCELRSLGKDGVEESTPPRGPTSSFNADIVYANGQFVQWPEGVQR